MHVLTTVLPHEHRLPLQEHQRWILVRMSLLLLTSRLLDPLLLLLLLHPFSLPLLDPRLNLPQLVPLAVGEVLLRPQGQDLPLLVLLGDAGRLPLLGQLLAVPAPLLVLVHRLLVVVLVRLAVEAGVAVPGNDGNRWIKEYSSITIQKDL